MKNKKIKELMYFIPALIFMIMIFCFSQQPGDVSTQNNQFIVEIMNKVIPSFVTFVGYDMLNFLVRKAAHVTEFMILFFLFFYGINNYYKVRTKQVLLKYWVMSSISTFLYACTDEIHQIFIMGRSGQFKDVMIDSIGIVIGSIILFIIGMIKMKLKSRQAYKE
ncbi:VanZ family protein [Hathewaya limosa]|uniref:VanZ family protein n=1 Tax=Hathewaya limosa TaxID=1536 RepID=A0ABU0JUK5_HATLI|nr:VanZ family protein [Hathewaya limosa]MDQ0480787.1 VanZ family protein [Hathewaya limosa]